MRRRFINTKSFEKNKITCILKSEIPQTAWIYSDYFDDSQITSMRINGVLVEKRPYIEVAPGKEYVIEITFGELFSLSGLFFETDVISVSGLETLDTKNVTDMVSTFSRANFPVPNLDMWDISNVQTMQYMFEGNIHITISPFTKLHDVLPSDRCYENMFNGCRELIKAPELPAKILTQECYHGMFYLCLNLNHIKMLATDISADGCLEDWVYNVSPTGTFIKNPDAEWDVRGVSGVPDGWTIKFDGIEEEEPSFEFPVYLNFDECEVIFGMTVCTRYADEISIALYSYLQECCIKYGVVDGNYYILHEDKIKELGIEIYVENSLVDNIDLSRGNIEMFTNGEYNCFILTSDGSFIYES